MKKITAILLLAIIQVCSAPLYAFVRPVALMLYALNNSHKSEKAFSNSSTQEIEKVTVAHPIVKINNPLVIVNEDGTYHVHVEASIKDFAAADINLNQFDQAQLTFCAITAGIVSATGKFLTRFVAIPKTTLGKNIRHGSTFLVSLYAFNQYEKVNALTGWQKGYDASKEKLEEFIRKHQTQTEVIEAIQELNDKIVDTTE